MPKNFDDLPYKLAEDYARDTVGQVYARQKHASTNKRIEVAFSYEEGLYWIDPAYARTPMAIAIQDIIYKYENKRVTDISQVKIYTYNHCNVYYSKDVDYCSPTNPDLLSNVSVSIQSFEDLQYLQKIPKPIATAISEVDPIVFRAYPLAKLVEMDFAVLHFFKDKTNLDPLLEALNTKTPTSQVSSAFFIKTPASEKNIDHGSTSSWQYNIRRLV
ncbi:hypothetical protein Lsan_1760 [Legionella santicrucis]|uniref:Uncharacterized protein n=1 Tax=Legionella santicrucis TaxID=45074 RepID=A0A0W0Z0V6_9GAMM|nr:hypothetical protein [Legionella santicrucis]KTD62773.1 hypothetical protein Lsan_1760 [Legionella santicrucis]